MTGPNVDYRHTLIKRKRITWAKIAGLIWLVLLIIQPTPMTLAQSETITAFVNVNIIPMDTERVLAAQTVIVQGDRITAIGPVDESWTID